MGDRLARRRWALSCVIISFAVAIGIAVDAAWGFARHRNESWRQAMILTGGNPVVGRGLVRSYGCGTCHTIPQVPQATATVGPPLAKMAVRAYIAGVLPNRPANMVRWLRTPSEVNPITAMLRVGMNETDARDIAAFFYILA